MIRQMPTIMAVLALFLGLNLLAVTQAAPGTGGKEGVAAGAIQAALARAGANRGEIETALREAPAAQREGVRFLVANMPDEDLKSLTSRYLLENVAIAYDAFQKAPWKSRVSREMFLNDILPYSCLNEKRDGSRAFLREKAAPLVADCTSPAEAAQRLNQKLFPLLNARYSTERKRPDQSPLETVESGKATCSGLSILLVDACRAVGVPARVAGTPMWTNMRGNHTWVEVWDGDWHFAGAAEPDPSGLDHGWFVGDAAKAKRDVPEHAIYASSFKKTGLPFPLVWAPGIRWVNAVNVTDRYLAAKPGADSGKGLLLIKVIDSKGRRVAAAVTVKQPTGGGPLEGISKDEAVDLNDILGFRVPRMCPAPTYVITAVYKGKTVRTETKIGGVAEHLVVLKLPR
jgi:transglutaminase-like putative cysteine protease